MKTKIILGATMLSFFLSIAPAARAGILDGLGKWEGSGTAFDVSGRDLGTFSVSMTRMRLGASKARADGKITFASGQEIAFWQEFEERAPDGFALVSSAGNGRGQCFDNGMCESFTQQPDGHAFATTMVKDSAERIRVLVTELEQGRAVRFYQETLLKKP